MSDTDNAGDQVKRGRGRPKKSDARGDSKDTSDEPKAKKGRGRPKGGAKKARKSGGASSPSKRGRGRPKRVEPKDKNDSSDQGGSGDEKDD